MSAGSIHYVIQMRDSEGDTYDDLPGMPNGGRGYVSLDEVRAVYAARYKPAEAKLGVGAFQVVQRFVSDVPVEI